MNILLVLTPISDKITSAFSPIINLILALAYPLAFIAIACGVLLIIIGQKHKGMTMIKWGIVGYICMQLLPGFMKVLIDVGVAMRQ